jgi:lipopolysaccharide export LptBFGC system permease protein LptF
LLSTKCSLNKRKQSLEGQDLHSLALKIRRKEKRFNKPSKEKKFKLHLQIHPKIVMPFFCLIFSLILGCSDLGGK